MSSADLQRRELKLTQAEGMAGIKRYGAITMVIALPGEYSWSSLDGKLPGAKTDISVLQKLFKICGIYLHK